MAFSAATEDPDWSGVTTTGRLGLLYVALVPMLLAYLAWLRALRLVTASTAATAVLNPPVIGGAVSGLWLGETFGARQLVVLAMTRAGVALAALR